MRKIIIICGLILVLFFIGCSSEKENAISKVDKTISKDTVSKTTAETIEKPKTVAGITSKDIVAETTIGSAETKEETVTIDWDESTKTPVLDKEIAKLVAASRDIDNYQYLYQPRVKDQYGNYGGTSYNIYIKGTKAKKVYFSPVKFNDSGFYNAVYLDLKKKTATGVCDSKSVLCREILGKKYNISYEKEKLIKIPKGLIQNIDGGAKPVEEVVIENKKVSVLSYLNKNNQTVRMSVDKYYGLPLKLEVYSYQNEKEILEEKYEFGKLIVGQVMTEDVNLN